MKARTASDVARLTAAQVMKKQVVTLSPEDTIQTALGVFEDNGISGAPVTDEDGRLVGVITLSDVARTEHLSGDRIRSERGTFEMSEVAGEEQQEETDPNEIFFAKEDYSTETAGKDLVGDWMTTKVVTVRPKDELATICAKMVQHQIHRVFVVDGERLVGVLSSFDVVRCVAGGNGKKSATTPRRSQQSGR